MKRIVALLMPEEGTESAMRASQVVAGYMAAAAIFGGIVSLFYYPGRLGPASIVIAVIAAAMGSSIRRFTGFAFAVASVGWLAGMVVAVMLDRQLF
jgi:hypothetical protein